MGWSFPGGAVVKNLPANAGDAGNTGLIPGSGRSSGGGNGNPLQYSCLENSMDRGAWRATVHDVVKKSDTTERQHRLIAVPQLHGGQRQGSQPASKMQVETQRTYNSKNISKKKNIGWLVLPDFNTYYKATVLKTVWYRSMKQNRKESKPSRWQSIDFWQRYQGIQWKRRESFQLMMLGQQDTHMQKKKKTKNPDLDLTSRTWKSTHNGS